MANNSLSVDWSKCIFCRVNDREENSRFCSRDCGLACCRACYFCRRASPSYSNKYCTVDCKNKAQEVINPLLNKPTAKLILQILLRQHLRLPLHLRPNCEFFVLFGVEGCGKGRKCFFNHPLQTIPSNAFGLHVNPGSSLSDCAEVERMVVLSVPPKHIDRAIDYAQTKYGLEFVGKNMCLKKDTIKISNTATLCYFEKTDRCPFKGDRWDFDLLKAMVHDFHLSRMANANYLVGGARGEGGVAINEECLKREIKKSINRCSKREIRIRVFGWPRQLMATIADVVSEMEKNPADNRKVILDPRDFESFIVVLQDPLNGIYWGITHLEGDNTLCERLKACSIVCTKENQESKELKAKKDVISRAYFKIMEASQRTPVLWWAHSCAQYHSNPNQSEKDALIQEPLHEFSKEIAQSEEFSNNPQQTRIEKLVFEAHPKRIHSLELGAAPGGWTQYIAPFCEKVVAVDPAEMDPAIPGNVLHIKAMGEKCSDQLKSEGPYHLYLCDINAQVHDIANLFISMKDSLFPGAAFVVTFKNFCGGKKKMEISYKKALESIKAAFNIKCDETEPVPLKLCQHGFLHVIHLMGNGASERTIVGHLPLGCF